jgi:hypothetical protein
MNREQRLARGRLLVGIAIAAMLGFSALIVAMTVRAGTFGMTQAVRLSLTLLLAYMLWQGRPWALKLTVVLAAITAVLFAILAAGQVADAEGSGVGVVLSGMGSVVYGAAAAILGTSRSVKAFLARQRRTGERRWNSSPPPGRLKPPSV